MLWSDGVCAGWSAALLVAHTILLDISYCGSYRFNVWSGHTHKLMLGVNERQGIWQGCAGKQACLSLGCSYFAISYKIFWCLLNHEQIQKFKVWDSSKILKYTHVVIWASSLMWKPFFVPSTLCTRTAQSSRVGCNRPVHGIVYLAIKKGQYFHK